MGNYKPAATPVDTKSKLSAYSGSELQDSTYCTLAGALQYLTFTHPDIAYAVSMFAFLCMILGRLTMLL